MKQHDDDRLIDRLRDALGFDDEVDPDELDMVMTGYDIVGLDVLVAELTYDSWDESELVPARAESPARMLTASGGGFSFEFEISGERPRLAGRVTPVTFGTIELDQIGNQQSAQLDASAFYEFGLMVGQPFRLRLTPEHGEAVATGWLNHTAG